MSAQKLDQESLPTGLDINQITIDNRVSSEFANFVPCFHSNIHHKNSLIENDSHRSCRYQGSSLSISSAEASLGKPNSPKDQKTDFILNQFSTNSTNDNNGRIITNDTVFSEGNKIRTDCIYSVDVIQGEEQMEGIQTHLSEDVSKKKIEDQCENERDNHLNEEKMHESSLNQLKYLEKREGQQDVANGHPQNKDKIIIESNTNENNSSNQHLLPVWWVSQQKENPSMACFGPALTRILHQPQEYQISTHYKIINLSQLQDLKLSDPLEIPIPNQEGLVIPPNQQQSVAVIPQRQENPEIQPNQQQQPIQVLASQNEENVQILQSLQYNPYEQIVFSYYELRSMRRVLFFIIFSLSFSLAFNMLLITLSIIGLIDGTQSMGQQKSQYCFEIITVSIILAACTSVNFLDLLLLRRLKMKEQQHLAKKEFTLMKLKPIELLNGGAAFKGICRNFPVYSVLQLLLKMTQFTVGIFALAFKKSKEDEGSSPDDSSTIIDRTLDIISICILVNLISYVALLVVSAMICLLVHWRQYLQNQEVLQSNQVSEGQFIIYEDKLQLGKCEETCIICYADYQINDKLIVLNCNAKHIFHHQCLAYWLEINKSCPICKQNI